jgi:nicotinamide riboside kinase
VLTGLALLLAPLNVALFTLGNDHVSVAELLGFVTGAASVWLTRSRPRWERRYLSERARGLQRWATTDLPRHDVYLLTIHDGVPWQDDGLREGDLTVRAAMTGWFAKALTAAGHPWVLLTGSTAERLALAVRVTGAAR